MLMRKILFPVLILLFPGFFNAFAEEGDFKLSLEPLAGFRYGQIDEYVFLKQCDYSDDKLSELNWELKNEYYAGANIEAGWKKIFIKTTFTAGIPMQTGSMTDSDWLNAQVANAGDYQYKTCYSSHDNYLEYDFSFGIKSGYDFDLLEKEKFSLKVRPFLGFDYNIIKFKGKNGSGSYGYGSSPYLEYNDENSLEYTYSGKVISYQRQTYLTWLGFETVFELFSRYRLNTGFQFSPYLYAESIDTHWIRSDMFADTNPGYFSAFKWYAGHCVKINTRNSINLNLQWLYIRVLRGDDYSKSVSASKWSKDSTVDGGAGEFYFDMSLGWKVRIF